MKITPLNKGIEDITWQSQDVEDQLPESTFLVPSEVAPEHEVEAVIYKRLTEESILENLKPHIQNREIINPMRFSYLTSWVPKKLQEIAKNVSTKEKLVFLQAADYLEEQGKLMEILNAYRRLLVQG